MRPGKTRDQTEAELERQGFDAQMKINNTLDNASLSEVDIPVHVSEENGTSVPITTNPDDLSAKFFIRVSNKENIEDISGGGIVSTPARLLPLTGC